MHADICVTSILTKAAASFAQSPPSNGVNSVLIEGNSFYKGCVKFPAFIAIEQLQRWGFHFKGLAVGADHRSMLNTVTTKFPRSSTAPQLVPLFPQLDV